MFTSLPNSEWYFPINACFNSDLPHLGFCTCDTDGRKISLQHCIFSAVTEIVSVTEINIFYYYHLYYP